MMPTAATVSMRMPTHSVIRMATSGMYSSAMPIVEEPTAKASMPIRISSAGKERADVAHAEADVEAIRNQREALNAELEAEVARLESEFDPATITIETASVKPRKTDIAVEDMALVWVP